MLNNNKNYLNLQFEQIETKYDPIYRALWCTLKAPVPVFTLTLLNNIRSLQDRLAQICAENPNMMPKYIIWQSDHSEVFNLGIDLAYIYQLIGKKDRENIEKYLELCIDVLYINLMKLDIFPLITICLVRGKAYGGGLEAALSCDIIVAEKNAKCCFPEIRYNLLPSVGTLKMLLRRYPLTVIEPILLEGKSININNLLDLRIIDAIVEIGEGEKYIKNKICQIHKRHSLYAFLYKAEMHNFLVTYKELDEFKQIWIKTALQLSPSNYQRLGRLVAAQEKISNRF